MEESTVEPTWSGSKSVLLITHLSMVLGVLAGHQIKFVIKKEKEGETFRGWCELSQCVSRQARSTSTETVSQLCDLRQVTYTFCVSLAPSGKWGQLLPCEVNSSESQMMCLSNLQMTEN